MIGQARNCSKTTRLLIVGRITLRPGVIQDEASDPQLKSFHLPHGKNRVIQRTELVVH